ncbi:unnamed protein product [Medioppia subpectinata]|uniref:Ran-GTPase activating protein 1 C-terminal domain-containing protein n=1 Tax=Medioppia subpectinata TaxID=1979941 RepID=A0A7R9L3U6_9ACAR|nr:unnamed protein product [Medioppia subpectinata]CAG2115068.1 unnamed protein product [Medioppia subpectinata]
MSDLEADISGLDLNVSTTVSFAGRLMRLDTEEDVEPIVSAVKGCQRLVTLNLEGNTLGISAAKQLAKSLESCASVENVLFNNLFTGRLKTEIPDVLVFMTSGLMLSNARLNTLDLSDNAIGPVGMPSLLPFLQSHSCQSLHTLRLNNCGLGVGGGHLLAKGLVHLKSLKTLICGRNRLEILGSEAIGNALAELHTLETLEMPQNGIHSKAIEAICGAIVANKGLKHLNLNDNNLKTEAKTIASALKTLNSIESINFGDCILKTEGCIAICEAIIESNASNLKEVILSGNEIGGQKAVNVIIECAQQLANSSNQTVKLKLELNDNNFGDSGVKALSLALEQLIHMDIKYLFDMYLFETHIKHNSINCYSNDEGSAEEDSDAHDADQPNEANEDTIHRDDGNEFGDKAVADRRDVHNSEAIVEELTRKIENDLTDINDLCSHFVQISVDGFDKQTSKLRDEALIESEVCLKCAIRSDPNEFIAMNALLVYLGLLKDETGVYKHVDDLRGPLSAITHSLGLLTPQQKHVLRAFMNRPNKSIEMCGKIRHNLMQQLFI